MNRPEIARALAKAMAHKAAGNDALAAQWAGYLLCLLEVQDIVAASDFHQTTAPAR